MKYSLILYHLLCFLFLLIIGFQTTLSSSSSSITQLCSRDQSAALLQFKTLFSINKTASIDCEHIRSYPKTNSWKEDVDCCLWDGISCDNISGQVISLDLSCSWLSGTLPSNNSLFLLSHLRRLDLSFNDFKNSKISSNFGGFASLTHLHLSNSWFYGRLPNEISYLSNLLLLDLSSHSDDDLILEKSTLNAIVRNLTEVREIFLDGIDMSSVDPNIFMNLSYSLTSLSLRYCDLRGNFPENSFNLPNIKFLILDQNPGLIGLFPKSNWSSPLEVLSVSDTSFSGELPESFGNLKSLQGLGLVGSKFSGPIPRSLGNLSQLSFLYLAYNNFSVGSSQKCIGSFSQSLSLLNLKKNNFHGIVPATFTKGCGLKNLNLNSNNLEGPLTQSIRNCKDLEVLDLGNNKINDTFPHWIEALPELQVLVLHFNKFQGVIGASKNPRSLSKLRIIDTSHNNFFGLLPTSYIKNFRGMINLDEGKAARYMEDKTNSYDYSVNLVIKGLEIELVKILTIFTSIDLSNNNFEGEIPGIIGELSSLRGLNLSHNNLVGQIPQSLGNLTSLEWLDISSNKLGGQIPRELEDLTFLSFFNISYNQLVGPIPQGKQFNTFENGSYEGNKGLCGLPISRGCSSNEPPPPPPLMNSNKDDNGSMFEFGWKIVVIGYGFGFIFGVAIGYVALRMGKPKWLMNLVGRIR
ncbi:hypothetical protein REPUB_Repub11eG0060000 [Reevesia pubescens]